MVTYTPNIPQPQDIPANSQSQILQNFQYLVPSAATTGLKRDHQILLVDTANTDGVHKQVTFAVNQATPGFIGNVSVLYPNTANAGSQLFFNNAFGNAQLTSLITGVPAINVGPPFTGTTFLPGGLLLQFGRAATNTLYNFPVAFSGASTPVISYGVSNGGNVPIIAVLNSTQFQINGTAGTLTWMAIGQAV